MSALTGVGLYNVQQAARLTGADAREVRRWIFGHRYTIDGKRHYSPPLWKTELSEVVRDQLGFRDLLELRVVKQFVKHGVRLPVIRATIENASLMFKTTHPLTTLQFLTDGHRLFYEAEAANGSSELTDVSKRQIVFTSIVRPALFSGIEFGKNGAATKWYPVSKSKVIVLDPRRSFGRPVLTTYGVSVETLVEAMAAERSRSVVAKLFDVPIAVVNAAIRFEERLAA